MEIERDSIERGSIEASHPEMEAVRVDDSDAAGERDVGSIVAKNEEQKVGSESDERGA